jgi:hypothetical protein
MYRVLGSALSSLLADANLCACFCGDFSAEHAVVASIMHLPWDIHVLVRVVRKGGVTKMELGRFG